MGKMKEISRKRQYMANRYLFVQEDKRKDKLFDEINQITDSTDQLIHKNLRFKDFDIFTFMGDVKDVDLDRATVTVYNKELSPLRLNFKVGKLLRVGDIIEGKAIKYNDEWRLLDVRTIISQVMSSTKIPTTECLTHFSVNPKYMAKVTS